MTSGWRDTADQEFSTSVVFIPPRKIALHVAGQGLSDDRKIGVTRLIRKCNRKNLSPNSIARVLCRAIRDVSVENARVGPNIMCTIVRRSQVRSEDISLRGGEIPLPFDACTEATIFRYRREAEPNYLYFPEDLWERLHYTPNYTCGGIQVMGGVAGRESAAKSARQHMGAPNTPRKRP